MRDDRVLTTTGTKSLRSKKAENQQRQTPVQPIVQPTGVPEYMLSLQRQYGNRFVQRVVSLSHQSENEREAVQTKLDVQILQMTDKTEDEKSGEPILQRITQYRNEGSVLNRWGGAEHENLTTKAAQGILEDPFFVYQVANASSRMDYKTRRLFWTGPLFLLSKVISSLPKGEGPEHGEDGNYTETSESAAAAQNMQLQDTYLRQAVNHYKKTESLRKEGQPVRKIGTEAEKTFNALGDACHIAQDRGAHWEGVKGKGHTDPRTKKGWDPDSPSDNSDGYQNALKNTKKLFEEWKNLTSTT